MFELALTYSELLYILYDWLLYFRQSDSVWAFHAVIKENVWKDGIGSHVTVELQVLLAMFVRQVSESEFLFYFILNIIFHFMDAVKIDIEIFLKELYVKKVNESFVQIRKKRMCYHLYKAWGLRLTVQSVLM